MTLRLELPLPPKELSPNAGKKWNVHMINRITQKAQSDTIALVREQIPRGRPLEQATVTVTFVVPDRRNYDKDNLIAASKPFLDGIVKAGVIVDDNWKVIDLEYKIEYQQRVRKTIIEVNP